MRELVYGLPIAIAVAVSIVVGVAGATELASRFNLTITTSQMTITLSCRNSGTEVACRE